VGVGPEGIPISCVIIEPSGNASADEAGRVWILGLRFQPGQEISWGRALLLWGQTECATPSTPPAP
jgi:hypothetical protein